jgi:hypothetical protein
MNQKIQFFSVELTRCLIRGPTFVEDQYNFSISRSHVMPWHELPKHPYAAGKLANTTTTGPARNVTIRGIQCALQGNATLFIRVFGQVFVLKGSAATGVPQMEARCTSTSSLVEADASLNSVRELEVAHSSIRSNKLVLNKHNGSRKPKKLKAARAVL